MVTVAQARTQLTQQRQVLASQKQQIIKSVIPALTPAQLRQRGIAGIAQQQLIERKFQSRKEEALKQLKPFEQQLGKFEAQLRPVEQQIKKQEQFNQDLREAQKAVDKNRFPFASNKRVRKLFTQLASGRKAQKQFRETIEELKAKGIKPIFVGGKAVGFEDVIKQISVPLPKFTPLPQVDVVIPEAKPTAIELPEPSLTRDIEEQRVKLESQLKDVVSPVKQQAIQAKLAALGVGATIVSTVKAVAQPVETIKGLGKVGGESFKFLTSPAGTVETPFASVGQSLRESPGFATGVGATLLFSPFKGTIKGTSVSTLPGKVKKTSQINFKNIDTQVIIGGAGKETVIRNIANLNSGFRILNNQGKITNTVAYTIKTADGRIFEALEFSKATGVSLEKGLVGKREILAFEVKKAGKPGEVLVGRAREKLTSKGGESFVELIRFKVPKSAVVRGIQRTTGKGGQKFEILQKTRIEATKTIGGVTKVSLRTEAGILRVSPAQRSITRNALRFARELRKGKSIESVLGGNLSKLKTLVNIERKLKGKKLFTKAEFEATFSKTLTQTELLNILDKISLTGLVKTTVKGIGLRLIGKRRFGIAGGADIKKLPKPFPKLVKKTPFKKTFVKEKVPIIKPTVKKLKDKFGRFRESRLVTRDKTRGAKAPKLEAQRLIPRRIPRKPSKDFFPQPEILRFPTAAPAIALAISKPTTAFGRSRLVTTTSLGIKSTVTLIPSIKTLSALRLRINQLQKNRQELLQIPRTEQTPLTQSRTSQLQKIIQLQKFKLAQLQRLRQLQKTVTARPVTPITPLIPFIPLIPPTKKVIKKKKLLVEPFEPKERGYNAFVKSKGKFIRANINPLTKKKARDLGAFITDQSLAATFKIVKSKKNAKKPKVKFPLNYFSSTKIKFRSPIRKGKKVPVKNLFIEKRGRRLDTLREVQKIKAARLIANLKKKAQRRIKPFKFKRV